MSELRKACKHGRFAAHYWTHDVNCLGGTEPSTDDLIQALRGQGWEVPPLINVQPPPAVLDAINTETP